MAKNLAPFQPVSRTSREYWSQSRQPLSCLIFLLPLLIVYEAGVLVLGGPHPAAIRNGADFWMRDILNSIGGHHAFLLPVLVTALLVVWHVWGKFPWIVSFETLIGMFAESILFAFCLIVIAQLQDVALRSWTPTASIACCSLELTPVTRELAQRVIAFLGAGVYEEVMFRLLLLPLCYWIFRMFQMPQAWAGTLAILLTSLSFALAHYIGTAGDPFVVSTFAFRAMAGLFFALLFVFRGFGITVGCHAAYDLLVGVLLVTGR